MPPLWFLVSTMRLLLLLHQHTARTTAIRFGWKENHETKQRQGGLLLLRRLRCNKSRRRVSCCCWWGGTEGTSVGQQARVVVAQSVGCSKGNFGCLLQWFRFPCLPRAAVGTDTGNDGESTVRDNPGPSGGPEHGTSNLPLSRPSVPDWTVPKCSMYKGSKSEPDAWQPFHGTSLIH